MCELRPHGPGLEGHWRFGLHQLLAVPDGTAATMRHELRLFVCKPAGARVTVQLKAAGTVQMRVTVDALTLTLTLDPAA